MHFPRIKVSHAWREVKSAVHPSGNKAVETFIPVPSIAYYERVQHGLPGGEKTIECTYIYCIGQNVAPVKETPVQIEDMIKEQLKQVQTNQGDENV